MYSVYLAVLGAQLVHQHVHVVRIPLPVLTAEVLQQSDGFMQPVKDPHHSAHTGNRRLKFAVEFEALSHANTRIRT